MAVLGPIPELRGPEQERHEDPQQGQAGRHHIEQDRLKEVFWTVRNASYAWKILWCCPLYVSDPAWVGDAARIGGQVD